MRALIQRVKQASVTIEHEVVGEISQGLLILLGVEESDGQEDIDWLVRKIVQLRIFNDADDQMNLSLKDIDGQALVVSQFTLHAQVKKGNRPSFIKAAKPDISKPLYLQFVKSIQQELSNPIQTGEFGAHMDVALINDGPVTIWMDSKNKE
tara:strand:+ start:178 stop:630 length:453 start_codon:yes stop_codon:yes gene_type:complete